MNHSPALQGAAILPLLAASPTVASPGAVDVAAWIGCLFFLVAGWNQLERFLDRRAGRAAPSEIQPQPLPVTRVAPPVSETLCRQRHKEAGVELARLGHEVDGLRQERQAEVGDLQRKISKVDREVGELRASIELNHQQLLRMEAKLDRVIERHRE